MVIQVNGEPQEVAQGLTIIELLTNLGIRPDRVAVELNRAIVKQQHWAATELPPALRPCAAVWAPAIRSALRLFA